MGTIASSLLPLTARRRTAGGGHGPSALLRSFFIYWLLFGSYQAASVEAMLTCASAMDSLLFDQACRSYVGCKLRCSPRLGVLLPHQSASCYDAVLSIATTHSRVSRPAYCALCQHTSSIPSIWVSIPAVTLQPKPASSFLL